MIYNIEKKCYILYKTKEVLKMKYADLHIHSSESDGSLKPKEIIAMAKKQNIKCISITDHDSISSQDNLEDRDILVIPGVEFSSKYKESEIHILGYYIDVNNERLINTIKKLHNSRIERTKEIVLRLSEYNVDLNINELLLSSCSIGRGNIADMMVKKGYVLNYKEAFTTYLAKGKSAYVEGEKLSCKEVIKLIVESGGIAVLAHPGKVYQKINFEKMILEFKSYGMKGIEVYHPSHSREQTNFFYNLTKKHKLLITGGSDFHGIDKSKHSIGSYGIDEELLNKIIDYKAQLKR